MLLTVSDDRNFLLWNAQEAALSGLQKDLPLGGGDSFDEARDVTGGFAAFEQAAERGIPSNPFLKYSAPTSHQSNILGCSFFPGNQRVVTCGMDHQIKLHEIGHIDGEQSIHCHESSVKEVRTDPLSNAVFLSTAEDGTVRQYDVREANDCSSGFCKHVLTSIRWDDSSHGVPMQSIALNPIRTNILSVGCGDGVVRLYDRRRAVSPFTTLAPLHLQSLRKVDNDVYIGRGPHITHVTWSQNGREILANYANDSVYLFGLEDSEPRMYAPPSATRSAESSSQLVLQQIQDLKKAGNDCFLAENSTDAIVRYTQALNVLVDKKARHIDADSAKQLAVALHGNRAMACLKRNWSGDAGAALADGYAALYLDPSYSKGHYRVLIALGRLNRHREAKRHGRNAIRQFPALTEPITQILEQQRNERVRERQMRSLFMGALMHTGMHAMGMDGDEDDDDEIAEDDPMSELHSTMQRAAGMMQSLGDQIVGPAVSESVFGTDDEASGSEAQRSPPPISPPVAKRRHQTPSTPFGPVRGRYCGRKNEMTDIKEAVFLGNNVIASGSDGGHLYLWDKESSRLISVIRADRVVTNCVQCHPSVMLLATSGIDPHVRMWLPTSQHAQDPVSIPTQHGPSLPSTSAECAQQ